MRMAKNDITEHRLGWETILIAGVRQTKQRIFFPSLQHRNQAGPVSQRSLAILGRSTDKDF